jgi:hypothetical protein
VYPVPPDANVTSLVDTLIRAEAIACTPPAVVGAEIATLGTLVYEPLTTTVIAVTVPPLLRFTPELPAAIFNAPVPFGCRSIAILVSVPTAEILVSTLSI